MRHFLNNLFEPKTNGPETASMLAMLLNVNVSASTFKKEIEEHPDYPSLLSVSDALNSYGIENLAIKIDVDKLDGVTVPFITQMRGSKRSGNFFSVVKKVTNNEVQLFDPEIHNWAILAKEDFVKRFSGIVLLAEADDGAGEKDYAKKIKAEKTTRVGKYLMMLCMPLIVITSGVIAFAQIGGSALLPFIFSVITLVGCTIGSLLLWYEVDQQNPVLQQICSAGKKINCGAVLQSKASKIAGVSWSAIGFTYFVGILLLLLFSGITNPIALFIISWLNVLALPYVGFSVYYQWRIAKQWCVLCLTVQGLLVLQFISAVIGGWHSGLPFSAITPLLILQTGTAFILPFIVTNILLAALQKAKESKRVYNELQKLKHNRQIFEALLKKQQILTISPVGLGIILGNSEASYKLLKVCNPYCGPCSKAHQPMENLLHNNPDLQLQIIFTATNNEEDIKTAPVKHLLAIAEKNEEEIIKQALDDWYLPDTKDYEAFSAKYPMNGELQQQNAKIEAMKDWCDKTGINFTPSFFVSIPGNNGPAILYFKLPEIYNVADLKYFFTI